MLHLSTPTVLSHPRPMHLQHASASVYSFPLTPSPNQTRTLRIPSSHSQHQLRLKPYHRSKLDFDLQPSSILSPITPDSSKDASSFKPSAFAEVSQDSGSVAPLHSHRAALQRSASLPQLQLPFPITPTTSQLLPQQVSGPSHAPIFSHSHLHHISCLSHSSQSQKPFIPPNAECVQARLDKLTSSTSLPYLPLANQRQIPLSIHVPASQPFTFSHPTIPLPSHSYVDATTRNITSLPQPDQTFGSSHRSTTSKSDAAERQREADAREKQAYAMELVEIAIKTVNRVWPESKEPNLETSEKTNSTPSSPLRPYRQERMDIQQLTPASSPEMIPRKRKINAMLKVEEDDEERWQSVKRRSVAVDDKPRRSPSSYSSYHPSSPSEASAASPSCSNPITLRLFVRELLRRSKTSVQTLEVALCYLDGVEDTVKNLRESYKSGKGFGTPELAEKGPYDEGSKDQGRMVRLQDIVSQELIKLRAKVQQVQQASTSSPSLESTAETLVSAVAHKVESLKVDTSSTSSTGSSSGSTAVSHSISPSSTILSESSSCPLIFRPPKMTPHQLLGTHPLLDARRTFLSALVLATKFLQDRAYSNKAWAKLSGLPGKEVGRCERALGGALGWRLWVGSGSEGENGRGSLSPHSVSHSAPSSPLSPSPSSSPSTSMPWGRVDEEGVHGVDDPLAAELIKTSNAVRDKEEDVNGLAKAFENRDVEGVLSIPGMREYIVLKNKLAASAPTPVSVSHQSKPLTRQPSALVAGMVELSRPAAHDTKTMDSTSATMSNPWSSLAALEKETPAAPVDVQTWSDAVSHITITSSETSTKPFYPPGFMPSSGSLGPGCGNGHTPLLSMTERLPEDDLVGSGNKSGSSSNSSSPLPPFVVHHQKLRKEMWEKSQQVQQQQAQWMVQQYQMGMQVPQFCSGGVAGARGGPGSMSADALAMLYKPGHSVGASSSSTSTDMKVCSAAPAPTPPGSFSTQWGGMGLPQQLPQYLCVPPSTHLHQLQQSSGPHSTSLIGSTFGAYMPLPALPGTATMYSSPTTMGYSAYSSPVDDAPTPTQQHLQYMSQPILSRDATLVQMDPLGGIDEYVKVGGDADQTPLAPFMVHSYF